ncbi:MAG: hypothetical protein PWP23_476 [Candidatus Sumerlaeota bacterium]|nr:hypothetical protein [Candidatus Sumerlaeota bacterium]
MRQILDRLILSDLGQANDPFFLSQNDVQAILYFGDGGMFPDDIKLYHRPALPDGTLTTEMLRDGVVFLRESLAAGRRVLAVGPTGATIVAVYLTEMGFSPAQAIQMLAEARDLGISPDISLLNEHNEAMQRRSHTTLGHR